MIVDLIDKWVKLGLTDGMDEVKIPKLVTLYESAARILIAGTEEGTFETVTFPIIYRVVRDTDLDSTVTAEEIITTIKSDFDNFCVYIKSEFKDNFPEVDVEAEAAAQVAEIIIEKIKNKTK